MPNSTYKGIQALSGNALVNGYVNFTFSEAIGQQGISYSGNEDKNKYQIQLCIINKAYISNEIRLVFHKLNNYLIPS